MIALIDYGAGNLTSVRKGFAAAGAELFTPRLPHELERATGVVVPGVGHFSATAALDDGWRGAIRRSLDRGVPLFGICLGQQWLFEGSERPRRAGPRLHGRPLPTSPYDAEGAARRWKLIEICNLRGCSRIETGIVRQPLVSGRITPDRSRHHHASRSRRWRNRSLDRRAVPREGATAGIRC